MTARIVTRGDIRHKVARHLGRGWMQMHCGLELHRFGARPSHSRVSRCTEGCYQAGARPPSETTRDLAIQQLQGDI